MTLTKFWIAFKPFIPPRRSTWITYPPLARPNQAREHSTSSPASGCSDSSTKPEPARPLTSGVGTVGKCGPHSAKTTIYSMPLLACGFAPSRQGTCPLLIEPIWPAGGWWHSPSSQSLAFDRSASPTRGDGSQPRALAPPLTHNSKLSFKSRRPMPCNLAGTPGTERQICSIYFPQSRTLSPTASATRTTLDGTPLSF